MANFNYNDNIVFDVYSHTYSSTKRMNVINDTPEHSGIKGHLQDVTQSIQAIRETVMPHEKPSKYRMVVRSDHKIDTSIREGRLVRVRRVKNKYTRGWEYLDTPRDYRITKINNLDADGRYIVLSLTDEGSDAPRS